MGSDIELGFPSGTETNLLVASALKEDVGSGDATTIVTVDKGLNVEANIVARENGIVAGLPLLASLFGMLDASVNVNRMVTDGTSIAPGDVVATLKGSASSILTGERIGLNFLQHLSGIATLTSEYVQEVKGTSCLVLDTRKTLPGYRYLAKYAVRCGGGFNHRMGLYDRIMLKDNHWAAAGGKVGELVKRGRELFPDLAIEVEVDTLEQLHEVLNLNVEWVLLDNFSFEDTRLAVEIRNITGKKTLLESSGNVTKTTIGQYARCGVDAASVGRLTHSAPALDLGLDMGLITDV